MGGAEMFENTDWAKEERLEFLARPMGEFWKRNKWECTITEWIPDYKRLQHLKKKVQGPLQQNIIRRKYDSTGRLIYPSNLQKHIIKKCMNSRGETIKIYNTDGKVIVDEVFYDYYIDIDMWTMLDVIEEMRRTRKRSVDVFIGRLYPEEEYRKYQKVDTIIRDTENMTDDVNL